MMIERFIERVLANEGGRPLPRRPATQQEPAAPPGPAAPDPDPALRDEVETWVNEGGAGDDVAP